MEDKKEQKKAYWRDYYLKNRDKILRASKERACKKENKEAKRVYDKIRRGILIEEIKEYDKARSKELPSRRRQLYRRAFARAKKYGVPCTITANDIIIPDVCPILGIPLIWTDKQGGHPNSPSLDRFDPKLGYVPGNIAVISKRANAMKYDASIDDVRKLLKWMEASAAN